jgi:hypothetical protein
MNKKANHYIVYTENSRFHDNQDPDFGKNSRFRENQEVFD